MSSCAASTWAGVISWSGLDDERHGERHRGDYVVFRDCGAIEDLGFQLFSNMGFVNRLRPQAGEDQQEHERDDRQDNPPGARLP